MNIKDFAECLHISTKTVSRMIRKDLLPIKEKRIDIMAFCSNKNIDLRDFYNEVFYSRRKLASDSDLSRYDFDKYWNYQNNNPAFKIGKVEYFRMEE